MARLILISYQHAFGETLVPTINATNSDLQQGKELFKMLNPVMAHDTKNDPCLSYANNAALKLWRRRWEEMIGMPSRLTAPESEQKKRDLALKQANQQHAIQNYQGIRVNSKGEHFMIDNARIWTLWNEDEKICGQAATFNCWWNI